MRSLRPLLAALAGLLLLAYGVLSGFARRPLSPPEAWTFAAAVLRATPAHRGGSSPLETLRLGGEAFGSPLTRLTLEAEGRGYPIPLPPRTTRAAAGGPALRLVNFATGEELRAYLFHTLPAAGWRYREQLGSVHAFERDGLLLSVRSAFYVGTRVGELRISLHPGPGRAAAPVGRTPGLPPRRTQVRSGPSAGTGCSAECS